MSIRHVTKMVVIAIATLTCSGALMTGIFAGTAGASTLTSSDGLSTLTTQNAPTPGTPYFSGQKLNVVVAANSALSGPTAGVGLTYIEECTDPGGLAANLPTTPANCEATTVVPVPRSGTSNGAFSLTGIHGFKVYDLPDGTGSLGSPTMTGTCDVDPNQCVLGFFEVAPNSSAAFTQPHLFSAPFQMQVDANGTDSGVGATGSPGDGTPELPLAIGLPLAAAAVLGGWLFFGRRRRQRLAQ